MTLLHSSGSEFTISDDLSAALPTFTRVAITTGRDDEQADRVRRLTTDLAVRFGWDIVLYDRSQERWSDHPHPSGPFGIDELVGDEFDDLRRQLTDIEAAAVSATAWIATVPSLTAMIDLLQAVDIDAVLLPADPDKPRLMERLLEGDDAAETVDRAARNLIPDSNTHFLVVADDEIRIETYEETS